MHISRYLLMFFLVIISLPASGFSPVSGMGNHGKFTGGLLLQDTRYQSDTFFDVEATMLLAAYTAPVNQKLSLGGGLGLVVDGELGRINKADDGSGFRLFFDGTYEIKQFGKSQILATFGLTRDSFSFKNRGTFSTSQIDFEVTELQFGGLFVHHAARVSIYGGLDLFLYSNGDIESGNFVTDIDRDDRLSARLGANLPINQDLDLRADLYLLSEQTVFVGADFRL